MKTRIEKKRTARARICRRVRKKLSGTADCPRLAVRKTLKHIYAQAIDDEAGVILTSASSVEKEGRVLENKAGKADFVGKLIAERLLEKKCPTVVFDRGCNPYHGLVKKLAEVAREAGLKF